MGVLSRIGESFVKSAFLEIEDCVLTKRDILRKEVMEVVVAQCEENSSSVAQYADKSKIEQVAKRSEP